MKQITWKQIQIKKYKEKQAKIVAPYAITAFVVGIVAIIHTIII